MNFIDTHQDPWQRVQGEDGPSPHPPTTSHRLLTLEQWHAVREHWPAGLATAVELDNDFDIEGLAFAVFQAAWDLLVTKPLPVLGEPEPIQ